jgi:alkanesulfonate monooxygenase SsuD/methylene tetrahydromethanopterin reductase-like flavin-dependent oxidoreductase (luciferase family)
MKVGVLEFGFPRKESAGSAIKNLVDNARLIESLNYSRLWLGEHYEDGVAWKNPHTLIAILAVVTQRINVGSAGILLGLNENLRVAADYKMLSFFFPGRIDLGMAKGRAPEFITPLIANQPGRNPNDVAEELVNYVDGHFFDDKGGKHVIVPIPSKPAIWFLASSGYYSDLVVNRKLNYSLSLFHNINTDAVLARFNSFKEEARKKLNHELPFNIAITCIVQDTEEHAKAVWADSSQKHLHLNFCGDASMFESYVSELQRRTGVEEIIVLSLCNTNPEFQSMLKLISEKLKLSV